MKGIKYVSIAEHSGYGVAARRYLLGLARSGIAITWTPMVHGGGLGLGYQPFEGSSIGDGELDPFCNKHIDYDVVVVHTVPEYYPHWVESERGKAVFGYTVWETSAIPSHWPPLLNAVDHLLVPCRWNKAVFERCGVTTPVNVVPHIAEAALPPGSAGDFEGIDRDAFVFYTIGVWTNRKAIWNTVTAYCDAFTAGDPTVLVIKTSGRDFTRLFLNRFKVSTSRTLARLLKRYSAPPRITLLADDLSYGQMHALHSRGDCYVSLCRSEGWGIGAFDAAAWGHPVVMTGYGGQLDYLQPDLAYLVDYDLVSVGDAMATRSYSTDQQWAEPNIAHAARLLREVFEHRAEATARARRQQEATLATFGEPVVTRRLIESLATAATNRRSV